MFNILLAVCLFYALLLFALAYWAERAEARGRFKFLKTPLVYTLSLSVYCTGWTFYGAVGFAARSGLEFLTIYLGPSLILFGCWVLLRRLVRVGKQHKVTSIADLISARFGKSSTIAVLVTILALIGTTPYIALQLQSVTLSFSALADGNSTIPQNRDAVAFWLAAGLALFTVLFGTRRLDANERHPGVVSAVALEAVVKLAALLAVGAFVTWHMAGGVTQIMAQIAQSPIAQWQTQNARWIGLIALSAMAFITLPRMFQVMVVENIDESHLASAAWAVPLYLFLMSIFVVPIAVTGLQILPPGSNPDLFVLSLPLSQGQDALAMFAFIGGFSAASSMVIVSAIALSTMVSNHIVMPVWLRHARRGATVSGDIRTVALRARRISILGILFLGYLYYRLSGGGTALAAIGLVAFTGVAQVAPALLAGLFWRGATRRGAIAGLLGGFALWAYTLFLPTLGARFGFDTEMMTHGPFGWYWARPQALFGLEGFDPLIHAMIWSFAINSFCLIIGSVITLPKPLEQLQAAQFVDIQRGRSDAQNLGWRSRRVESEDLMIMLQRIVGAEEAHRVFATEAAQQGRGDALPLPTPEFLDRLERFLAGSVGVATAHAMVSQIAGSTRVSLEDLIAVADESAQIVEYSQKLQKQSQQLQESAAKLRSANQKLTQIAAQKDAFLSQISHELRTPMTSIRAFSEILCDPHSLSASERQRYASIIFEEAVRLTRLLDALLDLSVLEHGEVPLHFQHVSLRNLLEQAATIGTAKADGQKPLEVAFSLPKDDVIIFTDHDRLNQVVLNLISNAQKYCDAQIPQLKISVEISDQIRLSFEDNGSGIPAEQQETIFEKFVRADASMKRGAGLGLAISRQIMRRLGGDIHYDTSQSPGAFVVNIPQRLPETQ